MKFLVINGPNLNMLGTRESHIYGKRTYTDLIRAVRSTAKELNVRVKTVQSNHEGKIVDLIQRATNIYDGIVINPGAYTHTSIAIYDALKAVSLPIVEVHISDIHSREYFRQHSYISPACIKTFVGKGFAGYQEAIRLLTEHLAVDVKLPDECAAELFTDQTIDNALIGETSARIAETTDGIAEISDVISKQTTNILLFNYSPEENDH